MVNQVLKVREDFYQQDFMVGDIVRFFEGKYKILNTAYRNQYGEFILCEFLDDPKDEVTCSEIQRGIDSNSDNR